LNKSRSVNLLGDAEGAGLAATSVVGAGLAATSVFAFLRVRFSAGEAEAAAGLSAATGEAAVVASAFLCARRFPGDGDAAGDSAVEGDAAASAGEAVAGLAAAGLADAEVFGLNKLRSVNLPGDAEGAGLAATSVFAFL
jgi:hypothetical protein